MKKKIFTNYRYYVLGFLCLVAILGIFAVPEEYLHLTTWTYMLISSKVIGLGAGYICSRLLGRWDRQGKIPELSKALNNF